MVASDDDLRRWLSTAAESFDTELKPWIDPAKDSGKAIIAKACIALRNVDGGFLIIGIGDDGSCLNEDVPADINDRFHPDVIHEIITKYASEPYEVRVHFVEMEGHPRVVIGRVAGVGGYARNPGAFDAVCSQTLVPLVHPDGFGFFSNDSAG